MLTLKLSCLLVMIGLSLGDLPPPERSYKILMLLPMSSKSHRNLFVPLAEALADRGHKVVMLSSQNKTSKNPNIEEFHHGLPIEFAQSMNAFEAKENFLTMLSALGEKLRDFAGNIYQVPQVKELYERRKEFDLIIILQFINEMMYPFLHEMPFITIVPFGLDLCQSAMLGNPMSPAFVQHLIYRPDLSSIFGRLLNSILFSTPLTCWREFFVLPAIQEELSAKFPDLPTLSEIDRNQSLTLINSHYSLEMVVPLLPSQIEVGGMHCRPGEPLPQDLQSWIEGAGPAGVVFFSLGSIVQGDTVPAQYRDIFVETFAKLKQRVIWKFEEQVDGVSKNVLIKNWLPQQDILAHPNVKVFISHGGGLSTQEASYHGVPMLVLPIMADQPKNAELIAEHSRGIYLKWEDLTSDILFRSILDIINNPVYKENMAAVSKAFRDQPQSPTDRAVFWTEYVIRQKGAPRLKSPAAKLSWVEFFLVDVFAILISATVVLSFTLRWILRKILRTIGYSTEMIKRIKPIKGLNPSMVLLLVVLLITGFADLLDAEFFPKRVSENYTAPNTAVSCMREI